MKKVHPLAVPALILAALFGGIAPIFAKFALKEFSPLSIVSIRLIFASIILWGLLCFKKQFKIDKKDILKIILLGILFSGNIYFFILGLQFTTAIVSQLMYLLVPMITILISFVFLRQKFSLLQILGTILGFIGGSIILGNSLASKQLISSLGAFKGNIIILLAVLSWSLYMIYSKILNKKYSPLTLLSYSSFIACLISLPIFINEFINGFIVIAPISLKGFMSILGLIFINSIGCFFLYQWGVKHTSAFTAASAGYISPLTTTFLAVPLFREKLSFILIFSSVLIFISVYLAAIYPLLAKKKK